MCGVIGEDGIQWERCNVCGEFTKMDNLGYLPRNLENEFGLDICISCTNSLDFIELVQPAKSWIAQYN